MRIAAVSNHSVFGDAGPAAMAISDLIWLFTAVSAAVFLVVSAALLVALLRTRRRRESQAAAEPDPIRERRLGRMVIAAAIVSALILTGLVMASYATDRNLLALERDPAVSVTITGHQWWWEVQYSDPLPEKGFVTANELHLPLNRAVKITLQSADVIHSFWLPSVNGKRDLLPGRTETIWLTATQPGLWRGRCAEFCGLQHAQMQLEVVVEPEADFDRWRADQAAPAHQPETEESRRGQNLFSDYGCGVCHTIRGAPGSGYSGTAPDLTHLQSRRRIAAGMLPNARGYLAGWISNPQGIKPGVLMPPNLLPPRDLQALISYLEKLR